jgi:hypothetical protein
MGVTLAVISPHSAGIPGASEGIYLLNRFAVGMLVLAWQISRDDQHLVVSEEAFHKAS